MEAKGLLPPLRGPPPSRREAEGMEPAMPRNCIECILGTKPEALPPVGGTHASERKGVRIYIGCNCCRYRGC